jgi:hypothetical protein
MGLHESLGAELRSLGGFLHCRTCGVTSPLGAIGSHLEIGWPKHCGYTMQWWTQRQIDAGEAPTPSPR